MSRLRFRESIFMKNGKIITSVLLLIICLFTVQVNAEISIIEKGSLYINNVMIETEDTVMFKDGSVLLPFRTIFEALGATVEWNEVTEEIVVNYNNEAYICYTKAPNPGYGEYFYVRYMDSEKNKNSDNHIYLTSMSLGGAFKMINDRTYLYQETGKRLFEEVGCRVEFDMENKQVHIFDNRVVG